MRASLACLLLIALAVGSGRAQHGEPRSLGRQVITAETLRHSGVRRLSEILTLIGDWDVTTVEGFTWEASPRGLTSYGRANWSLLLDGQLVDLAIFGVRSLDRLPVTLGQIDSVTVVSTPVSYGGTFAEGGIIHIHSHRPRRGLSLHVHGTTANETGDPGPFRFTELATPNIDRVGSGASAVISYAGARGYLEAGALYREHYVTDPAIRQRNFDISVDGEYPIIKQGAASLRAGLRTDRSRHAVYLGRSFTRDYFFLKPFGRELPVESKFTHIGADGNVRLPGPYSLAYRLAYSSNALERHDNTLDLDYDWRLARWRAQLRAQRQRPAYSATLGLEFELASAETGYPLSDDAIGLFRAGGALAYRLGAAHRQVLALQLTTDSEQLGVKAALTHRWRFAADQRLEAVVAYFERIPAEDDRIWFWLARGYHFLRDAGVPATIDGELGTARALSLDLGWAARLRADLQVRIGGYLREAAGLSLEDQPFQFDAASGAFAGPVLLSTDESGAVGGAELGADWAASPRLEISAYYRAQRILDGDPLFEDAWRTVPKHRLRLTALFTPWESSSFWGSLRYRSASRWADYRDAAEASGGAYRDTLEDALVFDLGAQKWFWNRRLRLHLLLHDVFDDAVPHHPVGAAYGLTFAVQGELLLDGIWKP